jgi:hypothetical protein
VESSSFDLTFGLVLNECLKCHVFWLQYGLSGKVNFETGHGGGAFICGHFIWQKR